MVWIFTVWCLWMLNILVQGGLITLNYCSKLINNIVIFIQIHMYNKLDNIFKPKTLEKERKE